MKKENFAILFLLVFARCSAAFGQKSPVLDTIHKGAAFQNKMQYIKGGTFMMGNAFNEQIYDEMPRSVTVNSFYLASFETTFAEYDSFCLSTNRPFIADKWGRNTQPIIFVNWFDAVAYCNWRSGREHYTPCYSVKDSIYTCDFSANGYRLPTEAEWEFAAREGGKTVRFGNGSDTLSEKNTNSDASEYYKTGYSLVGANRQKTLKVTDLASKNALGLHHLAGNVWEWCNDWYGLYPSFAEENPTGAATGKKRVLRGGSWCCSPQSCTVSHRYESEPQERANNCGFRVCRKAF
ncbi:MAG: hypothetical protein RI894_2434 [Bacteroidota bacterium]|jgi:formylglycine-generating enzyme required for sulfatase activity